MTCTSCVQSQIKQKFVITYTVFAHAHAGYMGEAFFIVLQSLVFGRAFLAEASFVFVSGPLSNSIVVYNHYGYPKQNLNGGNMCMAVRKTNSPIVCNRLRNSKLGIPKPPADGTALYSRSSAIVLQPRRLKYHWGDCVYYKTGPVMSEREPHHHSHAFFAPIMAQPVQFTRVKRKLQYT